MKGWFGGGKIEFERAGPKSTGTLVFNSVASLERGLDGSEERFAEYYFALYQCSPDEPAGINLYRQQLRDQYPNSVVAVGNRFILTGQSAWLALAAYYQALIAAETLSEEFRAYAKEQLERFTEAHRNSQALPVPIDLMEGQLATDDRLGLLTCIALRNGQVSLKGDSK
jgi:hypothetical protein